MASKLEYLQRYLSGGGGDAEEGEKKKKKKLKKLKKAKSSALGTHVVDADDTWEKSAPSREDIEKKWELDAAEDEQPLVVTADGEELVDPQDLPVYVDSDKYLDEFRGRKKKTKENEDGDLSPPRKKAPGRPRGDKTEDEASPPRRPKSDDASPPRIRADTAKRALTRGRDDSNEDTSPPRRPDPRESSTRSPRQRRVDSLGRDIPPRSSRSERWARSASREDEISSRHRDRKSSRNRSRSRGRRDRDRDASRRSRERRSRSRSPRMRCRRDSRSPSRRRSPRRSTRWSSPRRGEASRGRRRSRSRSRGKRRSRSSSHHSRSPSHSPRRRSSRGELLDVKKERSADDHEARKDSHAAAQSPSRQKFKSEPREIAKQGDDDKKVKRESKNASGENEEKKAGLFTASEFEHQRKIAAKRKDVLWGVNGSEMGANAETVYRDKRGRKLDMLNEMVRQQEILDGKRKREEREEYEWGTGEVQKKERTSQQELLEQMKKTPFARHEDDEELERKCRERVRAFDPINSKVFQEGPIAEVKIKKKKSKKDKKNTSKAKPKYAGPPAPPNRFGIQPGYRWDGVVRGTNWEEKIMMRQNANTAVSEEAYKYAVADM